MKHAIELLTPPPPMLLDMRWVGDNPAVESDSPMILGLRNFLQTKPGDFFEQMALLERQWLATERTAWEARKVEAETRPATTNSPSEELSDENTQPIVALIERLEKAMGER
jgi:hypothetical protein